MYKYIAILLGLIFAIVILILIGNLFTGGAKLSYEKIEEKLVKAAQKYAKDHPAVLPVNDGTSVTISSTVLVGNDYINDLSSYAKDSNVNCNGSVEIYLTEGEHYDYVPNFSCGNKYNTTHLYEQVIRDNDYGVVSGSGLYERRDGEFVTDIDDLGNGDNYSTFEYVFRGDEVNNFVKIDDNYWRIVAINDNNDMLLLFVNHSQKTSVWDDRYNEEFKKSQGINIYEQNGIKSRAMERVEDFYRGDLTLMNKEAYSSKTRYLTVPMNLCVGKRTNTDSDISGNAECSVVLENQYAGLLPAYYYMSASLDSNCNSIISKSCGNYNYLSQFDDYWWLLTANSEHSNEVYGVARNYVQSNICSYKNNIRPTIMLGSRVLYEEGNGSESNPYTIKFYD